MKKLPIGLQNFKEIIERGYLYVDKTRQIFDLIDRGKLYFFSRPRRFGKSLTISALYYVFKGEKDLFKGLYIAEKTDYDWEKYPVLEFNFAAYGRRYEDEELRGMIRRELQRYGQEFGVELPDVSIPEQLRVLIQQISQKHNPVVLLIDEYDKPIIDFVTKPEKARANREVLWQFFAPLKSLDLQGHLRFLFITGVSKFSKVSLFSDLNNLKDLTMKESSVDLVGITQDELLTHFSEHINLAAQRHELSEEELLQDVKSWYNGYSYDGVTTLYNPFSLLSFFDEFRFQNYWFATGTPYFFGRNNSG